MKKPFYLIFLLLFTFLSLSHANEDVKIGGDNLYIYENVYDNTNRYLILSDGSFWLLNYTYESFWDRFSGKDAQALWLAPQRVEIKYSTNHKYPYLMINLDTNESVEVRQANPNLLIYKALRDLDKPHYYHHYVRDDYSSK